MLLEPLTPERQSPSQAKLKTNPLAACRWARLRPGCRPWPSQKGIRSMAEIIRPHYHVDGRGKLCSKGTPGARRRRSKTWWIRYRDEKGKQCWIKVGKDKTAAQTKISELVKDDNYKAMARHAKRPLV